MAKSSIIKAIKAKPNQRGKTSHLALECTCKASSTLTNKQLDKRCNEDFLVSYPINHDSYKQNKSTIKVTRKCAAHFYNTPQQRQHTKHNNSNGKITTTETLRKLGLI